MFEVGFTEIVLILGLALLVLGPEKLPGLAEKIGRWTGRARSMARQLRSQLEQEVTLDELGKRSRAMHTPPPQDATATDTSESSTTPTADAADAPEHRTGPQEAQPYSPPHADVEPESDHAFSVAASDIEPPPAAAEPAIAATTTTTKDGQ